MKNDRSERISGCDNERVLSVAVSGNYARLGYTGPQVCEHVFHTSRKRYRGVLENVVEPDRGTFLFLTPYIRPGSHVSLTRIGDIWHILV